MNTPRLLFIVGSFRPASFNRQFAQMAQEALQGKAIVDYAYFHDVPYYIAQIEYPAPLPVERIREQVQASDGIWFFTPEYNGSYPGAVKNLVDWLSRPVTKGGDWQSSILRGKKVTTSSCAGKNAGRGAIRNLNALLTFTGCSVLKDDGFGTAVSAETFTTDLLSDTPDAREHAKRQAEAFLAFLQENQD